MFKYFDKTFLKFLLGFVAILMISFAVLMVAGYYEERNKEIEAPQSTSLSGG